MKSQLLIDGILAMLLAMALLATVKDRVEWISPHGEITLTPDMASFQAAARAQSLSRNPYNVDSLASTLQREHIETFAYVYSPVLSQLLQPFSDAPYTTFQSWWTVLSCASLATFVVILVRLQQEKTIAAQVAIALAFTVVLPVHYSLVNGQIESFLAPIFALVVLLDRKSKWVYAGVILGVLFVLKHAIVFVCAWFVWRRSWKMLGTSVISAVVIVITSVATFGVEPWVWFVEFTSGASLDYFMSIDMDPSTGYNVSWTGLALRWGAPIQSVFKVFGPGVFIISLLVFHVRNRTSTDASHVLMFTTIAGLLALPFTWSHHFLYAAIPAVWWFERTRLVPTWSNKVVVWSLVTTLLLLPGAIIDRVGRKILPLVEVSFYSTFATVSFTILMIYIIVSMANHTTTNSTSK